MEQYDSRIDVYINKSAPFAQPILEYIREVVHEASPLINETIKWSMPFYDYKGTVCMMAAFKQHCAFGFWKASRLNDPHHLLNPGEEASAGSFGRVSSITDLPAKQALIDFVLQAIELNEKGIKTVKIKPPNKAALVVPDYFINSLSKNEAAKATFESFSYSQKKDYVEWLTEAKSEATRQKRLETAVEWIGEGKTRNWKYQR
jgi:uncharacterized protein YdeI (YjbR/CyaY-like superfamily)